MTRWLTPSYNYNTDINLNQIKWREEMKVKIYLDKEKTQKIYDIDLYEYLIIVNNEMFKDRWQVIEIDDTEITRKAAE
jgi:hypothetical protein